MERTKEGCSSYLSAEEGIERYDRDLPKVRGMTASELIIEKAQKDGKLRVLDLGGYGEALRDIHQILSGRDLKAKDLIAVALEDPRDEETVKGDRGILELHILDATKRGALTELGKFDIILCRSVLWLFDERELATVLANAAAALEPGGVFLADLTSYDPKLARQIKSGEYERELGVTVSSDITTYDEEKDIFEIRGIVMEKKRVA